MPLLPDRRLALVIFLLLALSALLLSSGAVAQPADPEDLVPPAALEEQEDAVALGLWSRQPSPEAGDSCATGEARREAYRRFKQRALRLRRRSQGLSWGTNVLANPPRAYDVWTPQARRIDRAETLALVGAPDLAARERVASSLASWSWALGAGASVVLGAIGAAGGAWLGYTVADPTLTPTGSAILVGGLIMLLGVAGGLVVAPVVILVSSMLRVDDDEALGPIQAYNREQAETVGLDAAEIPFTFLGY